MIDDCRKCGESRFIVNKTHYLCDQCNRIRLDGQGLVRKQPKPLRRSTKPLKRRAVKRVTGVQKAINDEYKQVIQQIAYEREHVCSACGYNQHLDNSHIIARSRCKEISKPHLITDKKNIVYDCRKCHMWWESLNWQHILYFNNLEYRLQYIEEHDPELYRRMIYLINQHYEKAL